MGSKKSSINNKLPQVSASGARSKVTKVLFADNETSEVRNSHVTKGTSELTSSPNAFTTSVKVENLSGPVATHVTTPSSQPKRSTKSSSRIKRSKSGMKSAKSARKLKYAASKKLLKVKDEPHIPTFTDTPSSKFSNQTKNYSAKQNKKTSKTPRNKSTKGLLKSPKQSVSNKKSPSTAGAMSSDDELEDVMLSLDSSNSYSPTKGSNNAGTMTPERPITPDSDLEEVMLSLNDSNTFSPTKRMSHMIPYYLANVRIAIEDVLVNPIDVQYLDIHDVMVLEKFRECEGLLSFNIIYKLQKKTR